MSSEPPKVPFSFGVRLGIFLMVESASLSAIAVSSLLGYVAYRSFKRYRTRVALRKWSVAAELEPQTFESDATDSSFFVCLMIAELIQAIGGLLNIQWIIDAFVTEGPLCTAQAILKQFGDVGVAFMSLSIAFQTFCVLVLRWHAPASASKYIIALIFVFITLMVSISGVTREGRNGDKRYYGDTRFWCWIRPEYETERIVFEYLWMWLAAFIMLILYGIIALVMRGILVIDKRKLTWNWRRSTRDSLNDRFKMDSLASEEDEEKRQSKAIANLMLFYPAVYIFCVFPVGLVRFLNSNGHYYIPPAATIFSSIVFSLSGLLNVILYVVTRPEMVSGPTVVGPEAGGYEMGGTRDPSNQQSKHREKLVHHHLGHLPDRDIGFLTLPVGKHGLERDMNRSHSSYLSDGASTSGSGLGHLPDRDGEGDPGHLPDFDPATGYSFGKPHNPYIDQGGKETYNPYSHQKLVSLDMGYIPDINFDAPSRDDGGGNGTGAIREISSSTTAVSYQHH